MTQQSLETEITIPIRVFFTPVKAEKTIIHPVDFAYEGHPAYVEIDRIEIIPDDLQRHILYLHYEALYEECMEWLEENNNEYLHMERTR